MNRFLKKCCIFLLIGFFLAGCGDGGHDFSDSPAASDSSATLQQAGDASALEQRIKTELIARYERQDERYLYYFNDAIVASPPEQFASDARGSASQSTPAYSTTNLQEQGVDEGDLVKTDGTHLFLARGTHFLVLRAQPAAESTIISDIDLKETVIELYLQNDRVIVVTSASRQIKATPTTPNTLQDFSYSAPATRLYAYEIANPASPKLLVRYDFPGVRQTSRRIESTIYLVTNHRIDLPSPASPWNYLRYTTFDQNVYERAVAQARRENLRMIGAMTLEDMIPTYSQTRYSGTDPLTEFAAPAVEYGDLYYPVEGNGTDLSLIFALDLTRASNAVDSSAVFTSWGTIYMSPQALYLASGNDWAWINPIAGRNDTVVNPEPSTSIHKFAIPTSGGKPAYRGSGRVPGWVNNQFSMSDHNGYLRIGTTRGGWWGEQISNQLSILAERSGELGEVGKIDGIAPGERIYSVRFDRDRGYMVTFRQTDPLFTLDLSDPTSPKIAGEIHVDGFSTYIHLLGEDNDFLLTIGRSADSTGRVIGNKLQIFDVTTFTKPVLVDDFELGSGWSSALYDHHAFLYYSPLSLLAIPYSGYGDGQSNYSSGLRLLTVNTSSGLVDRGTIPVKSIDTTYGTYADTVDRSVIIGNNIYAIASETVSVAEIDPLNILTTISLPPIYRGHIFY